MSAHTIDHIIELIHIISGSKTTDTDTQEVIHIDPPSPQQTQGHTLNVAHLSDYMILQLNTQIQNLLQEAGYQVPTMVIESPKMTGPDFTICIKDIFDLNRDKYQSIKQCSDIVYKIITEAHIDMIDHSAQASIFVNLYCKPHYTRQAIKQILKYADIYGSSDYLQGQSFVMEYSSPNMGKQMGIGHLRSTIIGQVLVNIISKLGARVLKRNYLGDRGTPFGKLIYSLIYHHHIEGKQLIQDMIDKPTETMLRLYAGFGQIDAEDKLSQAKIYFNQLEQGYEPVVKLRNILRQATLVDFQAIYDQFEIEFDITHGESFTQQYLQEIEEDLNRAKYMTPSQGAMIVRFEKCMRDGQEYYIPLHCDDPVDPDKEYEVTLIRKSDGATLYATRDLALMKYKASLGYQHLYNIVGAEQNLHFKLVSALAQALGYLSESCDFQHIAFGMYLQDGQKMATRKGNIWRLSDLIINIADCILAQFESKTVAWENSRRLAISSLMFQDIKNDRIKDINFDIHAMTKLNGDTGIYIHYTLVRLQALYDNINCPMPNIDSIEAMDFSDHEYHMIITLSMIPLIIIQAYQHLKPHLIAQYTLDLVAQINHRYSTSEKITSLTGPQQQSKKLYVQALIIGLTQMRYLLHLPSVSEM